MTRDRTFSLTGIAEAEERAAKNRAWQEAEWDAELEEMPDVDNEHQGY